MSSAVSVRRCSSSRINANDTLKRRRPRGHRRPASPASALRVDRRPVRARHDPACRRGVLCPWSRPTFFTAPLRVERRLAWCRRTLRCPRRAILAATRSIVFHRRLTRRVQQLPGVARWRASATGLPHMGLEWQRAIRRRRCGYRADVGPEFPRKVNGIAAFVLRGHRNSSRRRTDPSKTPTRPCRRKRSRSSTRRWRVRSFPPAMLSGGAHRLDAGAKAAGGGWRSWVNVARRAIHGRRAGSSRISSSICRSLRTRMPWFHGSPCAAAGVAANGVRQRIDRRGHRGSRSGAGRCAG